MRAAAVAELAVTVLGVAGLLGFLMAGRMDDANASPFDIFALVWFFTFAGIKLSLPWLLKRAAARRSVSEPAPLRPPLEFSAISNADVGDPRRSG
jgi:hypothetical protein